MELQTKLRHRLPKAEL